jgi:hypothetical protein
MLRRAVMAEVMARSPVDEREAGSIADLGVVSPEIEGAQFVGGRGLHGFRSRAT